MNAPTVSITVNGLRIAHAVTPPLPPAQHIPILMLHGWGAHSGLMWSAAEALARLGWRCYVPDLPGFGASAPPEQAWDVRDYATFALHYADAHNLERFHIIGHSFGGRLALMLGAEHGERIDKMALANSAGLRAAGQRSPRLSVYKMMRRALNMLGAHALAERLRTAYNQRYGSPDFVAAAGVMRDTFVRVVSQDLSMFAQRVTCPTVLFWGDQDTDTPLWMGRKLETLIPDAGLIVFEGAGHYSYLERGADFVRIVDHFLRN